MYQDWFEEFNKVKEKGKKKMCKYCYQRKDNEISGKPIFQYEFKKTAGYEPPEKNK